MAETTSDDKAVLEKLAKYKLNPGETYHFHLSNGYELVAVVYDKELAKNHAFNGEQLVWFTVRGSGRVGINEIQMVNWSSVVTWRHAER